MDDCEDVRRAFMAFDTDGGGTIAIKELTKKFKNKK